MIVIHRNPNGDTRTASKDVTFEEFCEANRSHKHDVVHIMDELGKRIRKAGILHDYTKFKYAEEFYRDFKDTMENGSNFVEGDWYQNHIHKERHHPTSYCVEDINLIDILECMTDVIAATAARKGEVEMIELPPEILQKAYENTISLIKDMIVIES